MCIRDRYSIFNAVTLFGMPKKVYGNAIMLESGVDGIGSIILSYDDKEVILMHSKITDTTLPSEIQGEDGTIVIDDINSPSKITLYDKSRHIINLTRSQIGDNMFYEIDEFIKVVKLGQQQSNTNTHEISLMVHEIITEIRKQIGLKFVADEINM